VGGTGPLELAVVERHRKHQTERTCVLNQRGQACGHGLLSKFRLQATNRYPGDTQ
jgi:hypothetical protein